MDASRPVYRATTGLNWEPGRRLEAGDPVPPDFPAPSLRHELAAGHLEPIPPAAPPPPAAGAPTPTPVPTLPGEVLHAPL